jgi:hypothetical protein
MTYSWCFDVADTTRAVYQRKLQALIGNDGQDKEDLQQEEDDDYSDQGISIFAKHEKVNHK